jgi:two-component system, chemotaxis family, chemotaxis protein CheY
MAQRVLLDPPMQPRKILVVDDSKLLHKMYQVVLGSFALVHANDGREALARLAEHRDIDLVLLDINMPNMNGIEVLTRLGAEALHVSVSVIVISTEGKDEDVVRALRLGAVAYIKKPFQREQVLDVITPLPGR